MNDFGVQEFGDAFAALSAQGAALGRYGSVVSEQCAAVEAGDLDRVDALALELDLIIADLDEGSRRLQRFQRMIKGGEVTGPRAAALRKEMLRLAESASGIEQMARGLARQLSAQRNAVGAELVRLDQQQRAVARYDVPADGDRGPAFVNSTA